MIVAPMALPRGRLLALDLGQARTGVAVCDELGMMAFPLTVLPRQRTRAADFAQIAALAARERAVGVLVGLPLDGEGLAGAQARWARRYAGRLAGVLATTPVAFWDESCTTADALRLVQESGGRTPLDAAAAAVMLNDYLAARRRSDLTACGPGPMEGA